MSSHFPDGMVVAPQPEAAEVGLEVLRAGGSAVDAALAVAFVQGVVDPIMCGIAGFGSMAVYIASTQIHEYIDFHAPAPTAASPDMWEHLIIGEARDGYGFILDGNINDIGYQSICVPASLKAYAEAHSRYGSMPWKDLIQPAIDWAKSGWQVRPHVCEFWSDTGQLGRVGTAQRISYTSESRQLYCKPDGSPKQVGDWVINDNLADTLAIIAKDGADALYTGELANEIISDLRANGGLLSLEDLSAYKPVINKPIYSSFREFTISTNQPPGGGVMLSQMLNILENFDLQSLGHNTASYIQIVAEAMKMATADKDKYLGDPAFVDVSLEELLSKSYAHDLASRIKRGEKAEVPRFSPTGICKDTTHISIIDKEGNCVSMTHSLGMPSGVITKGLGFMYNGCMGVFDPRPNRVGSIAPRKARASSICPSIVFRDNQPYLVIGAPGMTQITMGVLLAVLNVLEFGYSMSDAVALPRFSATSNAVDVCNRIPRFVTSELESLGYQVIRDPRSFGFALVHGIKIDGNELQGGADPGGDGVALS
ncbi:gamma-glutamyltransferase [Pseudovibrio brasiliensis]|uniref:Glutathione hydrolase proenzyme n=1 Tax=Pseudovibrio brasiliensis TaxID=1898042 RepID=A0ABX8ASH4_9HYPH|nr:gamma-glutamyltransferase [Pseudovibrio brasiliensis]QUS56574.1 gamma-glutamyltransferase [Pseudovibrio brasiliensis]